MKWLFLASTLGLVHVAYGTSSSWNITGSGNWNVNGNWTPATFPNAVGDSATFGNAITGNSIINSTASITVGNITFNNTAGHIYNIQFTSPFTLTLNNGAPTANITVQSTNTAGHTINTPISVPTALTVTNNSSGSIEIDGAITGAGSLTLAAGTLNLDSSGNSYGGGTTINGGILSIQIAGVLPSAGAVTINTGFLDVQMTAASLTIGDLSCTGSSISSGVELDSGKTLIFGTAANTSFSGSISPNSGSASITKQGTGNFTFTGSYLSTIGTTINNGTFTVSGAGTLSSTGAMSVNSASSIFDISGVTSSATVGDLSGVASSSVVLGAKTLAFGTATASTTFAGVISGSGGAIIKQGSGISLLTGVNTFTGGTTINAGTISLSTAGALASTGAVSVNSSSSIFNISAITASGTTIGNLAGVASSSVVLGAKALTFGTATASTTFAGVISGSGGSIVKQGSGISVLSGINTFTGGTTINAGSLNLSGSGSLASTGAVSVNSSSSIFDMSGITSSTTVGDLSGVASSSVVLGAKTLTFGTATASTTFAGVISGSGGSIIKQGSGIAVFSGVNTFTGGTTINAGTVSLSTTGSLASTGAVSVNSATSIFDISAITAGSLTIGDLSGVASSSVVLGVKNLTFGTATSSTTFAGVISGSGGSITKQGSGTTVLSGVNTFTGSTTINAGTLSLSVAGSLSSTGAVSVNSSSSIFDISGITSSTTIGNLLGVASSSVVLGSKTLTFGTATASVTFAGVISGSGGSIVKQGSGIAAFTGISTFTGSTTINAGTLSLSGSGSLSSTGAVSVNSSTSVFSISGTTSGTTIGDLSGVASSNVSLGTKALTFGTATASTTFAGSISGGGGSIIKQGSGIAIFTGSNGFSGGTTINDGTLRLSAGGSLLATGAVSVNSASSVFDISAVTAGSKTIGDLSGVASSSVTLGTKTLIFGTATSSTTFAGVISGGAGGSITKQGTGTAVFSGVNTFTGTTTINDGTLSLSGSGSLTGAVSVNSSSSIFDISGITSSTTIGDLSGVASSSVTLGAKTLTFGTATASTTFAGVISGSGGSIVKQGSGIAVLSGANSYTGTTTVSAGTLTFTGTLANTISGTITVNAGNLILNKNNPTGNVLATQGPITINGGTCQLGAPEQILDTATVTIAGGTFDMNSQAETIGSLIFNSGALLQGALLSLTGTTNTTLTMGTSTVVPGDITFTSTGGMTLGDDATIQGITTFSGAGGIVYNGTSLAATIGNNIALGTFAHTFNINDGIGPSDLVITGAIAGSGASITMDTGTGTLEFNGATPNTYSGLTTLNAGTLLLNKTITNSTINGNVLISGGELLLGASDQINDAFLVTLSSGTWDMAGFNESITQFIFTGGTFSQGGGLLTLTSGLNTALTMGNGTTVSGDVTFNTTSGMTLGDSTTVSGTTTFSGAGDIIYNGTTTAATLGGTIDLGSFSHIFNIADGTAATDLLVSGVLNGVGGSVVKQGAGTLSFTAGNNYTGGTTINAGTVSINGDNLGTGTLTFNGSGTILQLTSAFIVSNDISLLTTGTFDVTNGASPKLGGMISGGALTKTGLGILSLTNGANSYTGLTTVSAGTLAYETDGCILAGNSVTVGDGITAATFRIAATMTAPNALNITVNANSSVNALIGTAAYISSLLGTGTLNLETGTRDINISPTGTNTFPGIIIGGVASVSTDPTSGNRLTKSNTGTLTLTSSSSNYVSRTFVANGVLEVQNASALGASGDDKAVYVRATTPATLQINGSISLAKTIFLNGAGFGGNGALRSTTGANILSGGLNIGWTGTGEGAATATIQVDAGSLTATGVVAGSSDLMKSGAGTLTFSGTGANTLSGTTTVSAGTLILNKNSPTGNVFATQGPVTINSTAICQLGAPNQILDTTTVTIAGGTFDMNSKAETIGSLAFNSGTLLQGALLSLTGTTDGALTMGTSTTVPGSITFTSTGGMTLSDSATIQGTTTFAGTGGIVYTGTTTAATISGNIALGSFSHTFNINDGAASADIVISGAISGSGGSIIKQGAGTSLFSGVNSYTGGTTINAGTLSLSGSGALASTGAVSVNSASSIFDVSGITAGSTTIGDLSGVASSSVVLSAKTLTFGTATASTTFAGVISGSGGSITKQGSGISVLSGVNTFTGGTTINNGTLSLSGSGALVATGTVSVNSSSSVFDISGTTAGTTIGDLSGVASSSVTLGTKALTFGTATASTTFAGIISGVGGSIVKQGSGISVLSGVNTFTGGTTINAGTLSLSGSGSLASTGAVSVNSTSSIFDISGTTSGTTIGDLSGVASSSTVLGTKALTFGTATASTTFAGVISGSGGSIIKQGSGIAVLTGVNTFTGGTTINNGTLSLSGSGSLTSTGAVNVNSATSIFDVSGITAGSTTIGDLAGVASSSVVLGTKTLTFGTATTTTTFAGVISGVSGSIIKQGSGTSVLSGVNTFTGGTTINAGTLSLSGSGALAATGAVSVNSSSSIFDISGTTAGTTIGDLSGVASSSVTLGTKALTFGTATASTTFAGVISGSGGSIVKQGSGIFVLSGINTFTGGTTINNGTLSLSGAGSLSSAGAVSVNSATSIFDISGITAGSTAIGDLSGVASSSVTLGTKALTFGTATASTTFAGVISGVSGSIIKQGSGISVLSGVNTFTGGTTINAGTLSLSGAGTLASTGAVSVNSASAVFDISGTAAGTTIGDLSGVASSSVTLGTKALTFGTATASTTFAGIISGVGGSIVKQGSGISVFSGANTFTGGTTINNGTLSLSGAGSLASTGAVSVNSASSIFDISGITSGTTIGDLSGVIGSSVTLGAKALTFGTAAPSTTFAGTISGSGGSIIKQGSGTSILSSINTFTGGTTINNGTLSLSGFGSLVSTGAVNVNSASSTFDISAITAGSTTIGDLSGVTGSSVVLGTKTLIFGTATASTTFAGVISGIGGSIIKQGSGTTILSGNNSYTGGTSINAGTLSISSNSNTGTGSNLTFVFGGGILQITTSSFAITKAISLATPSTFETVGVTTTLSGMISGGALTKIGTGTLILTNGTNNYTGLTTINAGTLSYGTDGCILGGNSVTVGDGVAASTFSIEATMTAPSALNVTINNPATLIATSGSAVELSTLLGDGILNLGGGNCNIDVSPAGADTFSGTITGGVTSASTDPTTGNRFTKSNTGTLTLNNAASDFVSRTFVANGVLEVQNGLALGAAGDNSAVYVRNATGPATLQIDGSITLAKTIFLNGTGFGGNGALRSSSGANVLSNSGLFIGWTGMGEAAVDPTIQVDTGSLTTTGVVSGGSNLTKSGAGTLTLAGATPNTLSAAIAVNAGTLLLNKNSPTGNILATQGPITINPTAVCQLGAPNQILDTTTVTIAGGTFDMNSKAETIGNLAFSSGTLLQGGALLSLTNATNTALTMGSGTTVPGSITFTTTGGMTLSDQTSIQGTTTFSGTGGVIYTGTTVAATISGDINLGTFAHTFNINNGTAPVDMIISGAISGSGIGASITMDTGIGTLEFSGSSANTYLGLTTINNGTLLLNKSIANGAIAGDVTINGATLLLGAAEQIKNSSTVTIASGGTWNMVTFNETIGQLTFTNGTLSQTGGTLSLASSATTALTMSGGTAISGPLAFTGSGGLTYVASATGATISGTVDLGSASHTFDIAQGAVDPDMVISGVMSGTGGINKINTGYLEIGGVSPNTFTGLTTVADGTLLMDKTSHNALPGNVTVSGGLLLSGGANQIGDSSVVTLSGGTWNLSTFTETINQLLFTSGTFTQGVGGVLTVASGLDTAVTMTNSTTIAGNVIFATTSGLTMGDGTTISGDLTFQGTGGVVYNGSASTATLSGAIDLGGFAHTFTTSAPGMTCSGVLSGSGSSVTKSGAGQLAFSGGLPNTYNGLTSVSGGTLLLNKTAGVSAIEGNILINGGTLLLNAANQIIDIATMTISSGSFNMGGALNNETFDNLVMTGGSVTQAGATLVLSPAGPVALSMGDSTSIAGGSLSLPGSSQVLFTGSTGTATVSSNTDLSAAVTHTFSINSSSAGLAMDLQGVVSGAASGITKTGPGTLRLSGSSANTFSGLTTISGGTLLLQKTGVNAVVGDVLIASGGTLALGASNQITDLTTATVTLNGGSMVMNGFADAVGSFVFNSGTLTQGGGTLSLTNPLATALVMGDGTVISGPLAFTSTGGLTYAGTTTTATISGSVDLGALAHTFDIPNGSAVIDQTISGPISGASGSFTKIGSGLLLLTGANTYGGGTTITAGTVQGNTTGIQGNILNNATLVFDQASTGTYAGSITGTGAIVKQGAGTVVLNGASNTPGGSVTVSSGPLIVNGSLAGGGTMTVASGALLGGTGPITKDITLNGTLAPGNSIGTITLIGDQIFASSSNLDIEVNPSSNDRVNITGNLTIQPGSTITIMPDTGVYAAFFSYTLVETTGGTITGTFTNILNTQPLFTGTLTYTANDILLQIGFKPFDVLVTKGNTGQVARCLSGFTPPVGSDLASIISQLRGAQSAADLNSALLFMQPSQFTAIAVMQENNTLYLNEGLFDHLESLVPRCQPTQTGGHLWAVPFSAHQVQKRHHITQGYKATTPGVLLGLDGHITKNLLMGVAFGYSHSDLKWTHHIGTAKEQAGYGTLYSRWGKRHGFVESSLIYGYSYYETRRAINFDIDGPIIRTAKGRHHGMQGSAHLKAAADWSYKKITFEPFAEAAYIYIHENSFKEKGAQSLDLHMLSKKSDLLMSEGGLRISRCSVSTRATLTPYVQASGIYERRHLGKHVKALFNGCPLSAHGLNPSRALLGIEAGLNITLFDQASIFSLAYKGRFAHSFMDNALYLQANIKF